MLIFEISNWDYPIVFIVLSLLCLYVSYKLIVNPQIVFLLNRYYKANFPKWILVLVLILLSLLFPLLGGIIEFYKIDRALKEKSYGEVEGLIENFYAKKCNTKEYDSFMVNGVQFKYTNLTYLSPYYHRVACEGGEINHNGQKVKIYYIKVDKKNKIIKIWLQK